MHGRRNFCAVSKLMSGGAVALLLAGCETYEPLALPQRPDLLDQLPVAMPGQPLDMDAVATIAEDTGATVSALNLFVRGDDGWRMIGYHGSGVLPRPLP